MKKKILLALTSLIIALVGYLLFPITTKHNLKIPSSSATKVSNYLSSQGYFITFIDQLFLKIFPAHQGWVYINKKRLARYKFLLALHKKGNYYTPFTIIPGETSYFILQNLSKQLGYKLSLLEKSYQDSRVFKEGNFIANTYNIPSYFNESQAIKFLLQNSFSIHKKIAKENGLNYLNQTYKKILIIASIVQKEAANKKEMPLVASVIYNRLKKKMPLQMDGTLNYGKYSHSKITPQRIKEDSSYYNTYKYKGLPQEPVCNVSIDAIKAALHPANTNYLYFMKKDNNAHMFSTTFKEHRKNIERRKRVLEK